MIADKIEAKTTYDGNAELCIQTTDKVAVQAIMDAYKPDKKYTVEVKQYRKKRSLDANAYCHVLCRKIAVELGTTETEVYQNMIRDYGVVSIRPEKEELVDDLCRMWDEMGLGNSHERMGKSKLQGYENVKFFYGSSTYDSKNMSRLIDGIVSEARELGIDTDTPAEIERIKQQWSM